MPKNKLNRFAENKTFENLIQYTYAELGEACPFKGQWKKEYFKNANPLILELGCGKGEYTIGLAQQYPEKNYIGVDVKGARLWRGCKTALNMGLKNVAFLRAQIDHIEHFFAQDEISEIWITFPDPQPKKAKARKRLTAPTFLSRYQRILKPEGIIHLKTDNVKLFEYTLSVIKEHKHHLLYQTHDLYQSDLSTDVAGSIQTFYEQKFLLQSIKINYLKFRLNAP